MHHLIHTISRRQLRCEIELQYIPLRKETGRARESVRNRKNDRQTKSREDIAAEKETTGVPICHINRAIQENTRIQSAHGCMWLSNMTSTPKRS